MTMLASKLFVSLCLFGADAKRIDTGSQQGIETEDQWNSGRDHCDISQNRFRLRTQKLQVFLNAHKNSDDMSVVARGRVMMKTSAVLRQLRRASDCPWVTNGNIEDIEAIGQAVRQILANNPCAPAAFAELQRLEIDGEGGAPLTRAVGILVSDSCEIESQSDGPNNMVADDIDSVEIEELVQDRAEEMLESEDSTSSLMEQSDSHRVFSWVYVGKVIGALMLVVLFTLGCYIVGATVGSLVGFGFAVMYALVAVMAGVTNLARLYQGTLLATGFSVGAFIGAYGSGAVCAVGFARKAVGFLADKNVSGAALDQ